MTEITAEQINLHSPYIVTKIDNSSFLFTSKHGVTFNVGFANDYMLMEDGAYQLFISNVNDVPSPNDPLVRETISIIIREFFSSEPVVVLYICDTSDDRQRVRDRLFTHWFMEYYDHSEYTMLHESIAIDDTTYYGSLLMRVDHPNHDEIRTKFHEFVTNLPSKLACY